MLAMRDKACLLAIGLCGFGFVTEAQAYIDPGSGSYLLQILIAGFLGLSLAFKTFWIRIYSFLTSWFRRNGQDSSSTRDDTP